MVECYLYFKTWDDEAKALFECLRAIRSPKLRLLWSDCVYEAWQQNGYPGVYALDVLKASDKKGKYCKCYRWDVGSDQIDVMCDDDIRGLINIMSINQTCIFCIYDNKSYPKNTFTVFRDIINIQDYPDSFYKLKCFSTPVSALDFFRTKGIIPIFSLEGNNDFELTTISPVQGAPVYRHKATKYLWYLDNMHKTHYEVFDSHGKKHIGEATIDGELDQRKKDSRKRPIRK